MPAVRIRDLLRACALLTLVLPVSLIHARQMVSANTTAPASISGAPPTIVAVGDSITAGSYDSEVKGGWVTRLATKLDAAYPQARITVRNAGIGGDTTWGVLARLQRDVISAHPQLVIVSIGTNDFNSGVPASTYAERLGAIVARLRSTAQPPVIVLASLLPFAGLPPARLRAEERYNDIIRQTAAANRLGYLDLFDQWLALGHTYWHSLRHDTVHPNPIGYELMASVTAAFLEAGYLSPQGAITAPTVAPTCAGIACGTTKAAA